MIETTTSTDSAVLEKLAKARAALNGASPRARGEEKQRIALDWIYRWGWSSSKILDAATGGGRSGIAARLVKNKLLRSTKTETGGSVKGIPVYLLTLTPTGLDEVERHRESLIQYELDPYKIDQTKLRHDGMGQMATASILEKKLIRLFKTPKELVAQSSKEIKQPDIIWINNDDIRIGVEIELSAKWDRKLDQFVRSCLVSLSKNANEANKVDKILLVSDSKAIVKRYTEAFTPGQKLGFWEKNERGFWSKTREILVPNRKDGQIECRFLEN